MPPTATSSRVASTAVPETARDQVFDLLRSEHRHIRQAFRDVDRFGSSSLQGVELVARTCAALEAHIRLEEELFYPVARTGWRASALVDAAEVRYRGIKQLLAELKRMPADDARFNASFSVLAGYMRLQMREEENVLFKVLIHTPLHWQALFDAMRRRQAELVDEYCLALRRGKRALGPQLISSPSRSTP